MEIPESFSRAAPAAEVPAAAITVGGFVPGALGRLVELHGTYYARTWGLGPQFEIKIAAEMAAFLAGLDPSRDGFWSVTAGDGRVIGTVAVDGRGSSPDRPTMASSAAAAAAVVDPAGVGSAARTARLRCFIVDPACTGRGVGARLLDAALSFCRERGHDPLELWTFAGLDPARHLYESRGFRLEEEYTDAKWGARVRHQRFLLRLADNQPDRTDQENVRQDPEDSTSPRTLNSKASRWQNIP